MTRSVGAVGLSIVLVWSVRSGSADEPPAPKVPKEIEAPAGHVVVFAAKAKGVQIYKSVAGKDTKLEWVLDSPLAELTGAKNEKVGTHFGGPQFGGPAWEADDGSRLVRDASEKVKDVPAPKPDVDVPWLLVRVKADGAVPGALAKVVYVQRIHTAGGKPPADPPKRPDTRVGVSYTATYVFFAPGK
jgi:hypothetical protein